MSGLELDAIRAAMDEVRSSLSGSAPDDRITAIVKALEAITRYIEEQEGMISSFKLNGDLDP